MFKMITVLFSIALIAVMAVAGIYYGGSSFSTQTRKTDYSEIVNAAAQIKGAIELYRSRTGIFPVTEPASEMLTMLVDEGFLGSVPPGDWTVSGGSIQRTLDSLEACVAINAISGLDLSSANTGEADEGCPDCSNPDFLTWPACQVP